MLRTARRGAACALATSVFLTVLSPSQALAQGRSPSGRTITQTDALRYLYDAKEKFETIDDYSCVFIKQERVGGKMQKPEFMEMKVRNQPFSLYLKWLQPNSGREVVYVQGQNSGKMLAHDTGATKVVAGTVALDPRGEMAMRYSRHPITSAGIGNLINKVTARWETESRSETLDVTVRENASIDDRPCICLETIRPHAPRRYKYYMDRLYLDRRTGLPLRFEGYGFPQRGAKPNSNPMEIYTYRKVRYNVRLTSLDFSADNPRYNFGRL